MVTATTERRPVRVTLEGEAYRPTPGSDNVLMVVLPSGSKVCLTEGLGITVEDIEPPRVWTDGDVVQAPTGLTYSRDHGEWTGYSRNVGRLGPHSDEETARDVRNGFLTVLRYQHGGDQ